MYNPNSVYMAMSRHTLESYWKNTSAFDTINTFITLNFDGLKDDVLNMLKGEKVKVTTDKFKNDFSVINSKDDALTALIHLGYLSYDNERKKAFIPNFEVATAFHLALETGNWNEIADTVIKQIKEKRYAGNLKGYSDEILLVGVNYDKETKKHECIIERYEQLP